LRGLLVGAPAQVALTKSVLAKSKDLVRIGATRSLLWLPFFLDALEAFAGASHTFPDALLRTTPGRIFTRAWQAASVKIDVVRYGNRTPTRGARG
jgi:hypothetical protein